MVLLLIDHFLLFWFLHLHDRWTKYGFLGFGVINDLAYVSHSFEHPHQELSDLDHGENVDLLDDLLKEGQEVRLYESGSTDSF